MATRQIRRPATAAKTTPTPASDPQVTQVQSAPAAAPEPPVTPTAPVVPAVEAKKPAAKADPTAPVKTAPKPDTCEVRPTHGFPIFISRQNILARPEVWTFVRRDNWIETQVASKILEVR